MGRFLKFLATAALGALSALGVVSAQSMSQPVGICTDGAGKVYVANNGNGQIVTVDAAGQTTGLIATVPGVWGVAWRQSDNSLICTDNGPTV
jgi:DNA-binding beta-propeller fold protein YncE